MTYRSNNNVSADVFESLLDQGLEAIPEILTMLLNQAMDIERTKHLQALPYERTADRKGYANGYKPKQLNTRVGKLDLKIPQTRDSEFYPSCLERGMRSERALKIAAAEMYFQGVSTRKVKAVMESLCGFDLTSTEVSQSAALLDEEFKAWRERKLGKFVYVYLDAMYEKIRYGGCVQSCAVLLAIGVNEEGHREILGLSVELSEHEVHWRKFLASLQERGLHGVRLFISDDHAGLKAARQAIFPSIPWQRCQFHLQQNAQSYVTKQSKRREVASFIRAILTAPTQEEAERLLNQTILLYEKEMPRLAEWMEKNILEGLTHLQFPEHHHRLIRTSNVLERLNREIRRRTKSIGVFPNTASCERLISAVLIETNDDWVSGKKYLTF